MEHGYFKSRTRSIVQLARGDTTLNKEGISIQKNVVVNKTSLIENRSPPVDGSLPENGSLFSLHENDNPSVDVSLYENERPVPNTSSPKDGSLNENVGAPDNISISENVCVSNPRCITPISVDISTSSAVEIVSADVFMNNNTCENLNSTNEEFTELVPVHIRSLPSNCRSFLSCSTPLFQSPTGECSSFSPTLNFDTTTFNVTEDQEQDHGVTDLLSVSKINEAHTLAINNVEAVEIPPDDQTNSEGRNEFDIDLEVDPANTSNGRPKKGRKRKYPDQNRQQRKKNCIKNKEYIDQRGKLHEEKEFRQYLCNCNCFARVGEENLKQEFKKYYSVDSHDAQRALIGAMVKEVEIKRKRVKNSCTKKNSRIYQVCNVVVCKTFFMQSFRISSCKINTALKTLKRPEGVRDLRGISGGHNKTEESRVQLVIEQIMKFPKYKSHYSRSSTEREFLNADTTLAKMYELYKAEVENPVSLSFYKHIFLTKFNLKRKTLKKDTCSTCDRLDVLINNCVDESDLNNLKKEKDAHLELSEGAQTARKTDMEAASKNPELETLSFDLQKTLPLPRIPTNVVYYKRQLCVYNLGIRSGKQQKGHCFVWVEGEAGRGSQEVGSCLRKFILELVGLGVKHLILWSDSCGGQNRNIKIVLILKSVLDHHPTLETVTMKYLYPGHSFLPNDSDFGDIESALKFQQRLYTPEDYMAVMEKCRKKNDLHVLH